MALRRLLLLLLPPKISLLGWNGGTIEAGERANTTIEKGVVGERGGKAAEERPLNIHFPPSNSDAKMLLGLLRCRAVEHRRRHTPIQKRRTLAVLCAAASQCVHV